MDPISALVGVLAAGATVVLKEAASDSVKLAYGSIKALLKEKLSSLANLEESPDDPDYQSAARKEIQRKGLMNDPDLLVRAHELVRAIEQEARERRSISGIDLEQICAAGDVLVKDLQAFEGGVYIKDVTAKSGSIRNRRASLRRLHKKLSGTTEFGSNSVVLQHLRAEGNIVVRLAGSSSASPFTGKIQAFLEEYLVADRGMGPLPFGGRKEVLRLLDVWLEDRAAPPQLMLTGPAGRGKSALLVHWIQRVDEINRSATEIQWHLAFVPISIRFGTNQPRVFYEALAARLANIVGVELDAPRTDAEIHYEDQCRLMLGEAMGRDLPILVVIDGADEALSGRFNVTWFPKASGSRIRLVVSARLQAGDRDAGGWVQRLGWSRAVRVQTLDLAPLARSGIVDLLANSGAPVDVLAERPEVVEQLIQLTGGEPLLLRLYVEDLWTLGTKTGRLTLEDLGHIVPGFSGYFADWFARQRDAWRIERGEGSQIDERVVYAYLAVLACAHGRLSAYELSEVTKRSHAVEPSLRIEDAIEPIRRFVIGTGDSSRPEGEGFVLSHPKLGEFLREDYLDARVVELTRHAFAVWGQEFSAALMAVNFLRVLHPLMSYSISVPTSLTSPQRPSNSWH